MLGHSVRRRLLTAATSALADLAGTETTAPWTPTSAQKVSNISCIIIIIIIIRQFIRRRNMSESLQERRTTSNTKTCVANSYYNIVGQGKQMSFKHVLKC